MRAPSRLFAALALLAFTVPRAAAAELFTDPTGSRTVELVHGFWSLVSDVSKDTGDGQTPRHTQKIQWRHRLLPE